MVGSFLRQAFGRALVASPFVLAAASGAPAANGDASAAEATPPFVWEVQCKPVDAGKRLACIMSQSLTFSDTGDAILRMEIVPRQAVGNSDALVRLSFPHGVVPSTQIGIQVDGGKLFKISMGTSDTSGLYASAPIGADFVTLMRAGKKLDISFILANGTLATVPVSLYGFSAAHDAIRTLMGIQPD